MNVSIWRPSTAVRSLPRIPTPRGSLRSPTIVDHAADQSFSLGPFLPILRCYASKAGRPRPWSGGEMALLTKLKHESASKQEILTSLPGRTWQSVKNKWKQIGDRDEKGELLHPTGWIKLSAAEKELLLRLRQSGLSYVEISKHLPGRTPFQLQLNGYRWQDLGLGKSQKAEKDRRPWSQHDLQKLRNLCENREMTWRDVASIMERTHHACKRRWYKMNCDRKTSPRTKWTPEEDSILIRMYNESAASAAIRDKLPIRSIGSIKSRKTALRHRLDKDRMLSTRFQAEYMTAQIAEMRGQGRTWAEIQKAFPEYSRVALYSYQRRYMKRAAQRSVSLSGQRIDQADEKLHEAHVPIKAETSTRPTDP